MCQGLLRVAYIRKSPDIRIGLVYVIQNFIGFVLEHLCELPGDFHILKKVKFHSDIQALDITLIFLDFFFLFCLGDESL